MCIRGGFVLYVFCIYGRLVYLLTMSGVSIKSSRLSFFWCCAYLSRERWCAADSIFCSISMLRSFLYRFVFFADFSWCAMVLSRWDLFVNRKLILCDLRSKL